MNYDLDKSLQIQLKKVAGGERGKIWFYTEIPGREGSGHGYDYEPWHFRYVGRDIAADVTNKGLTLEEYFGIVEADPETGAETTPGI